MSGLAGWRVMRARARKGQRLREWVNCRTGGLMEGRVGGGSMGGLTDGLAGGRKKLPLGGLAFWRVSGLAGGWVVRLWVVWRAGGCAVRRTGELTGACGWADGLVGGQDGSVCERSSRCRCI